MSARILACTTLAVAGLPTVLRAEVCDKERPGWDGTPATMLSEAIGLFSSPMGLFLSAALVVAVLFRHALGVTIVSVLWAFFVYALIAPDPTGIQQQAIIEGCIAQPTLFIGLSTAICAAAVYYTMRREPRL
ncbi:hypothetical protein [Primorskyibacter sp. S187A]|uniref:hypothetical protein n=1 Tax=Primorskyibacter sp. S187A TaxID=3415130 RepID=UPI003C7DCD8F